MKAEKRHFSNLVGKTGQICQQFRQAQPLQGVPVAEHSAIAISEPPELKLANDNLIFL